MKFKFNWLRPRTAVGIPTKQSNSARSVSVVLFKMRFAASTSGRRPLVDLRGLVVLAESPDAPEGDPDADAHAHHSFFFPDYGASAASATGFGWRGGDGRV